ncbi:villin, putative [Entamoeba invadens IP1]|uniref:Villin, putative n=1 Tax=Entamoeba invadens IP1 TaxID=370355 RepID=A0A0A1UE72_ENTIV|nr:villin, putative [Entamoeba invadens IP1]ELP94890.1 villin, putative [Entamoeba invadens IP1]|eukprot:XP_004261661.1 villin, putative [Entamoeba invadens IP1]
MGNDTSKQPQKGPPKTNLDLSNQFLTELPISVKNYTSLVQLNLNHNTLSSINVLSQIHLLTNLDVSKNELETVDDAVIVSNTSLLILNYEGNKLKHITPLINCLPVFKLNFSENEIVEIPDTIGDCIGLTYLSLAKNQLVSLPPTMSRLKSLKQLILYGNKLKNLPLLDKSGLTHLDVADNEFDVIPKIVFKCPLVKLYLDSNNLSEVPNDISELIALKELTLSSNVLRSLPKGMTMLPSLQVLDVEKNDLGEFYDTKPSLQDIMEHISGGGEVQTVALSDKKVQSKYDRRKASVEIQKQLQLETKARTFEPAPPRRLLIRVFGEGNATWAAFVPFERGDGKKVTVSIYRGDAYLFDTGKSLTVFYGKECNKSRRQKCDKLVAAMKKEIGVSKVDFIDCNEKKMRKMKTDDLLKPFNQFFQTNYIRNIYKAKDVIQRITDTIKVFVIAIQRHGPQILLVPGRPNKTQLNSNTTVVLDTGVLVYVWYGKDATPTERTIAVLKAEEILESSMRRKDKLEFVIQGAEFALFNEYFVDNDDDEQRKLLGEEKKDDNKMYEDMLKEMLDDLAEDTRFDPEDQFVREITPRCASATPRTSEYGEKKSSSDAERSDVEDDNEVIKSVSPFLREADAEAEKIDKKEMIEIEVPEVCEVEPIELKELNVTMLKEIGSKARIEKEDENVRSEKVREDVGGDVKKSGIRRDVEAPRECQTVIEIAKSAHQRKESATKFKLDKKRVKSIKIKEDVRSEYHRLPLKKVVDAVEAKKEEIVEVEAPNACHSEFVKETKNGVKENLDLSRLQVERQKTPKVKEDVKGAVRQSGIISVEVSHSRSLTPSGREEIEKEFQQNKEHERWEKDKVNLEGRVERPPIHKNDIEIVVPKVVNNKQKLQVIEEIISEEIIEDVAPKEQMTVACITPDKNNDNKKEEKNQGGQHVDTKEDKNDWKQLVDNKEVKTMNIKFRNVKRQKGKDSTDVFKAQKVAIGNTSQLAEKTAKAVHQVVAEDLLFQRKKLATIEKGNARDLKRLIHVKGKKKPFARLVECSWMSLNSGDAFLFDPGKGAKTIYVWLGKDSNTMEKGKAANLAKFIALERNGAKIQTEDEGKESNEFWFEFGKPTGNIRSSEEGGDDVLIEQAQMKYVTLYKYWWDGLKEKVDIERWSYDGKDISKTSLETNSCYILDCYSEMYMWVGGRLAKDRRQQYIQDCQKRYLERRKEVWIAPLFFEFPGYEQVMFKERFCDFLEAPKKLKSWEFDDTPISRGSAVDYTMMLSKEIPVRKEVYIDNADGKKKIWRIEEFNRVDITEEGEFFESESYIVQYTYVKWNTDFHILYFWQGRNCPTLDKGACARLTVDLHMTLKDEGKEFRVAQNTETTHFLSIFSKFVVRLGKDPVAKLETKGKRVWETDILTNTKASKKLVFDIRRCGVNLDKVKAVEIEWKMCEDRLTSEAVFLITTETKAYIWKGKLTNTAELTYARNLVKEYADVKRNEVIEYDEGKESAEFWKALGGKRSVEPRVLMWRNRLFEMSSKTGVFGVEEVTDWYQDDLEKKSGMLLDCYDVSYLWVGKNISEIDKKFSMETVGEYIARSKEEERNKRKCYIVQDGKEPFVFTNYFHGWRIAAKQVVSVRDNIKDCHDELMKLSSKYSYDDLLHKRYPKELDKSRLEDYLSDEEFIKLFKMTRPEFEALPGWKKQKQKYELKLY